MGNQTSNENGTEWVPDYDGKECSKCRTTFSITTRKHHCRNCGEIFCQKCSSQRLRLYGKNSVRVCDCCVSKTFSPDNNKQVYHVSQTPVKNEEPVESDEVFKPIRDTYETLDQVQDALKDAGLESSNLILGIDYTLSNNYAGYKTFGGRGLHSIDPSYENPYQQVIRIVGSTLEPFDDDKLIPAFGFGDSETMAKSVFPFFLDRPCHGFQEVLQRYNELTPTINKSGPTSFAPIIKEAINIVKKNDGAYHILIIIADGLVTTDTISDKTESDTRAAIVEASKYALSILVIGVGDGPWDRMEEFDDGLPERLFDNFQFVDFFKTVSSCPEQYKETNFSLAALMEIPTQYKFIKKFGLLGKTV